MKLDMSSDQSILEFVSFVYGDNYLAGDPSKVNTVISVAHSCNGVFVNTSNGTTLVTDGTEVTKIRDNLFEVES